MAKAETNNNQKFYDKNDIDEIEDNKRKLRNNRNLVEIFIGNKRYNALVDSGAQANVISESIYKRIPKFLIKKKIRPKTQLITASGEKIEELHSVILSINICK